MDYVPLFRKRWGNIEFISEILSAILQFPMLAAAHLPGGVDLVNKVDHLWGEKGRLRPGDWNSRKDVQENGSMHSVTQLCGDEDEKSKKKNPKQKIWIQISSIVFFWGSPVN